MPLKFAHLDSKAHHQNQPWCCRTRAHRSRTKMYLNQYWLQVSFSELKMQQLARDSGSFGRVFKARWNGTSVAVKVITKSLAGTPYSDSSCLFQGMKKASQEGSTSGLRRTYSMLGCSSLQSFKYFMVVQRQIWHIWAPTQLLSMQLLLTWSNDCLNARLPCS